VKSKILEFDATRQTQVSALATHLNCLEDTIASIHSTVDSISSKMARDVLDLLMALAGILTQQNNKLDAQSATIDRLVVVLETLTTDVKWLGDATEAMTGTKIATTPNSPPHQHLHKKQKAAVPDSAAAGGNETPMRQ
jgi:hypothetical protein